MSSWRRLRINERAGQQRGAIVSLAHHGARRFGLVDELRAPGGWGGCWWGSSWSTPNPL